MFHRRHFAGKTVVASSNVGCFLGLSFGESPSLFGCLQLSPRSTLLQIQSRRGYLEVTLRYCTSKPSSVNRDPP